ncbi:helix-turn-helix domain-containing protein [Kribbella sp. NPDC020789]
MPTSPGPPTVRLRRLAAELSALRAEAQLTREQVEERTGVNQGTLWRLEKGRAKPQSGTLETLFDLYGVPPKRRTELIDLAKDAKSPGWLGPYRVYADEISPGYATYMSFEAEARTLHNFEALLVPGLLQTPEYARASLLDVVPIPEERIEKLVRIRTERQAILTRPAPGTDEPVQFWAVIDEAALRREVGGRAVMRAQLRRLLELTERPNVNLQVLPFDKGAHPGMIGSFIRLGFGNAAPDLICEERWAGNLFLEQPSEVERYGIVFDTLRAMALGPRDTIAMIAGLVAQ